MMHFKGRMQETHEGVWEWEVRRYDHIIEQQRTLVGRGTAFSRRKARKAMRRAAKPHSLGYPRSVEHEVFAL